MEGTEDDAVFHWGREVDVQWGMLTWVTFRDQVSILPTRRSLFMLPR
jgi:hypothetical protein